jgi:hypothetical protein
LTLAGGRRAATSRLGAALIVLALAGPEAALAQDAPAQPAGRGPAEIRDDHLLAQARLTLPAVSPHTVREGAWTVDASILWSNSFSWTQDVPGEEPAERRFLLDGETLTIATTVRRGLGPHLDVGLRVPLRHRGGGALDGFIDTWHRLFKLEDAQRPSFRRNAFRVEGRTTAGEPFGGTEAAGTGLGDVELNARWRALDGAAAGVSVALIGRLSLPTATGPYEGSGFGGGGQIVVGAPLGRTTDLYLGAGLTVQDPGPVRTLEYHAMRGQGFAAFEWRPWPRVSLIAETNAATRLVDNIDSYPGVHWVVNLAGRLDLTPGLRMDVGLTENLIDQQSTTDLGLYFALGWRP